MQENIHWLLMKVFWYLWKIFDMKNDYFYFPLVIFWPRVYLLFHKLKIRFLKSIILFLKNSDVISHHDKIIAHVMDCRSFQIEKLSVVCGVASWTRLPAMWLPAGHGKYAIATTSSLAVENLHYSHNLRLGGRMEEIWETGEEGRREIMENQIKSQNQFSFPSYILFFFLHYFFRDKSVYLLVYMNCQVQTLSINVF